MYYAVKAVSFQKYVGVSFFGQLQGVWSDLKWCAALKSAVTHCSKWPQHPAALPCLHVDQRLCL